MNNYNPSLNNNNSGRNAVRPPAQFQSNEYDPSGFYDEEDSEEEDNDDAGSTLNNNNTNQHRYPAHTPPEQQTSSCHDREGAVSTSQNNDEGTDELLALLGADDSPSNSPERPSGPHARNDTVRSSQSDNGMNQSNQAQEGDANGNSSSFLAGILQAQEEVNSRPLEFGIGNDESFSGGEWDNDDEYDNTDNREDITDETTPVPKAGGGGDQTSSFSGFTLPPAESSSSESEDDDDDEES